MVVGNGEALAQAGGADVILVTGNSYKAATEVLKGIRPEVKKMGCELHVDLLCCRRYYYHYYQHLSSRSMLYARAIFPWIHLEKRYLQLA
jgi:hypothetical protein